MEYIQIDKYKIPVYEIKNIIIGTGCAGYNAADWLYDLGETDVAILTEGINMGTSRNTGSDKQTYYKMSLASDGSDSVSEMTATLFEGGCVNGDTALIEAACSIRSFIKLANLGVPFPTNRFGEYVGYKTDHDPRQRATSAGPLTSKFMTECLEKSVKNKGIEIFDGYHIIKLLENNGHIDGLIAISEDDLKNENHGIVLFKAKNIVLATGGPAGIYSISVYPESQTGMSGIALEIGAKAFNLQEWQYGLASTKFRWNVSGTYQQVLPKYIAIDKDGNEREFLLDYFENPMEALDMVFLKGYQWPFDSAKIKGSSIIDLIVYNEAVVKGNKVYMDFRFEPTGLENGFDGLNEETYNYLKKSNALIKFPINRLAKMNSKAIDLYKANGIDLYSEPLEVNVCAQHCNGGIGVDENWETNIKGLYVVGEAAGTFGIYRPGGSALNSTQVGGLRAAQNIAYSETTKFEFDFDKAKQAVVQLILDINRSMSANSSIIEQRTLTQQAMSENCAFLRKPAKAQDLKNELEKILNSFFEVSKVKTIQEIPHLFKNRDIYITQLAVMDAIIKSAKEVGSRGGSIVCDDQGDNSVSLFKDIKYRLADENLKKKITVTTFKGKTFETDFEDIKPIPQADDWFENVWNDYIKRTEK